VYVYRFSDLALLDQFNTLNNPKGLLALSPHSQSTVLACPSITRGHVRVELYDARKSTLIPAHEAELGAIALNESGSKIATCSEKGTLIRVYDTHSGSKLKELRRGTERAEIQSLCFSQSSDWLACTSDKGTVHIFSLEDREEEGEGSDFNTARSQPSHTEIERQSSNVGSGNKKSGLSFVNKFLPNGVGKYFESEWSYAQGEAKAGAKRQQKQRTA